MQLVVSGSITCCFEICYHDFSILKLRLQFRLLVYNVLQRSLNVNILFFIHVHNLNATCL